jgi:polysaccharide biosynthesis/export protein
LIMKIKVISILGIFMLLMGLYSCKSYNLMGRAKHKSDIYQLIKDTVTYHYSIREDDKISVSIWDHENVSIGSIFGIYNSNEVYGKWLLVDSTGQIALPKIGKFKIVGLTCENAADSLTAIYDKFINNPIVVVRVLNKDVTVLGEVRNPGTYSLDKDKNYILDAVGRAGGFDFYANTRKITLIRNENGVTREYIMDFTTENAAKFNQIPIHPGDIIQVPTRSAKIVDKRAPIIVPFASAITAVIVLIKFLQNPN